VLFPTYYTGSHTDNLKLVQSGRALDPERWFVVVPNLFGNGISSSPSNHLPQSGADFPRVTLFDNVRPQQRLLTEELGVERVELALGWSMGAQQAYHHAALFPERVASLLAVCGSARTSPHNAVFLAGVKAALLADPAFAQGRYREPPLRGLGAFGRVYAGWAYSQAFFRNREYEALGHVSIEALLDAWAFEHQAWDANDLLCMLWSWQRADISDNPRFERDLARALAAISARSVLMPASTDLTFTPTTTGWKSRISRTASCGKSSPPGVTSLADPIAIGKRARRSTRRSASCSVHAPSNERELRAALFFVQSSSFMYAASGSRKAEDSVACVTS
jgi:homoserine O-acetyltransferase